MSYQLAARDPEEYVSIEPRGREDPFATLVGGSEALRDAIALARRMSSRGGSNVLLVGETGTGKEVFARAIHAASPRANAPFVAVNCAAIPAQLLESELFGHERGAFTDARQKKQGLLELAREGTLFLDELSSLPLDLQPKLLRALEERRVRRVGGFDEIDIRCRVTTATNVPLELLVEDGSFREDLFYRLNVLRLVIPPLRAREGDVPTLAEHFLAELAVAQGLPRATLTPAARALMEDHSWPGNVRELKNVLERALVMCEGRELHARHLALGSRTATPRGGGTAIGGVIQVPTVGRTLRSVEAELVALTLSLTNWNKSAAARVLGISRPTLHRKIDEYGLAEPATV
jgi:transcriptional regulator with PAS, ATPase and Fis domain